MIHVCVSFVLSFEEIVSLFFTNTQQQPNNDKQSHNTGEVIYGLILHEWIFKEFACLKSKKEKNDIRKGDYIKDHNKEECSANIDKQQKN